MNESMFAITLIYGIIILIIGIFYSTFRCRECQAQGMVMILCGICMLILTVITYFT